MELPWSPKGAVGGLGSDQRGPATGKFNFVSNFYKSEFAMTRE